MCIPCALLCKPAASAYDVEVIWWRHFPTIHTHTHTHTRRNCELIVRIFAHLMVLQDRVEVHFNPAFAQYSDVYKHSQTSTYSIAVVAQMKIPARNPRNTDRAYENRLRCAQRESTWGLYRRYTLARLPRHSPAQGRRARPGVGNVYLFVRCVWHLFSVVRLSRARRAISKWVDKL